MVDFAKLREQSRQRAREQLGNASVEVRFTPVPKTQLEIIQELYHGYSLNEWEEGFCKSCMTWMNGKPAAKLSDKQAAVLQRMIVKYEIDPMEHRDIAAAQNNNVKAQAALRDIDEDDIPF